MIDNFELIKPLLCFNELNNKFFHCQIVQRVKDHKPNKVKEDAIKTYCIKSKEHLDKVKDEIILLCEYYGARAYINIAGKSFGEINKFMLMKLSSLNYENNLLSVNPCRLLNSVIGSAKSETPRWIVDIDNLELKDSILNWLDIENDNVDHRIGRYLYIRAIIPTVQGCHLITTPFNLEKFHREFSNVDVHKNSGTLLYYPKSLEK